MRVVRALVVAALMTGLSFVALARTPAVSKPSPWLTPAEKAGFEATPSYDETLAFVRQVAKRFPAVHLAFYGTSGQGRPMPVVIVSKERAFTPAAAARTGKPVVLLVSGIHAGEIDGKDASLILLRDMAEGKRREVLDAATLLVVPIFNVDGHERVSRFNRPNQDGPHEGMGFRTNAAGLNLNRDHIKADSPEMKAFIALFNAWRPHLHVDNHVTDGCEFDWTLTYAATEAPQAAPGVAAWLARHLPKSLETVEAAGYHAGPYVDLVGDDPSKGFESFVGSPRLASGYVALRNRPSILVEMHSYKPYRSRVLANLAFLAGLVEEVGKDPRGLVDAVAAAERWTVEKGQPDAPPSDLVLEWEVSKTPDHILFPAYAWHTIPSIVSGKPLVMYEVGKNHPVEVPWFHAPVAVRTTPRPRGYFVLAGWPQVEERLRVHGLVVKKLTAPADVPVEELRVSKSKLGAQSYQGQVIVSAQVEHRRVTAHLPAGTLWIPADQPDFEIAAQLLEPESPDSLFAFGYLSSVVEQKEYIDPRVLEPLAAEMLKNPAIAAAWEKALADPAFAQDGSARYRWWYQRTPYWDETVGRMPVYRAMVAPEIAVAPW